MSSIHSAIHFFRKIESYIRAHLSQHPVVYSIISGVAIVLFWRGVWHLADDIGLSSIHSILISLPILLLSGVLISYFVADRVLLSGLKQEERIVKSTAEELREEDALLHSVAANIKKLSREVKRIEKEVDEEIKIHHTK